jgi:hypothetical protein
MTSVENCLAGVENPSPGVESGSLASAESVYVARAESIPGPIAVNIPTTWAESVHVLGAMILVLGFC